MACELCNLEKKTIWYYEDDYFIVCDCKDCNIPMIVLKRHAVRLNQEEMIDLMWLLCFQFQPGGMPKHKLVQKRSKIKNHWHAHIA